MHSLANVDLKRKLDMLWKPRMASYEGLCKVCSACKNTSDHCCFSFTLFHIEFHWLQLALTYDLHEEGKSAVACGI